MVASHADLIRTYESEIGERREAVLVTGPSLRCDTDSHWHNASGNGSMTQHFRKP